MHDRWAIGRSHETLVLEMLRCNVRRPCPGSVKLASISRRLLRHRSDGWVSGWLVLWFPGVD